MIQDIIPKKNIAISQDTKNLARKFEDSEKGMSKITAEKKPVAKTKKSLPGDKTVSAVIICVLCNSR